MSAEEKLRGAVGREQFTVLAKCIDELAGKIVATQEPAPSLEEETDLLVIEDLATQLDCAPASLMKNLKRVLGEKSVLRIGNRYFIRRVRWRDYLRKMEGEG